MSHLCLEGTATLAWASSKLLLLDTDLQDVFLSTVRMHLTLAQEAAPQMAQHWPVAVSRNVSQALQCRGKLISWVERPVYSHLQVQEVLSTGAGGAGAGGVSAAAGGACVVVQVHQMLGCRQ